MRFTAAQKLRHQADFVRARQQGSRMECGPFVLNAYRDAEAAGVGGLARIGVVTAKKMLGDAVHRNRMRRVFREIFRLHPGVWPAGWDVVVVPRRSSLEKTFGALERRYLESSVRMLAVSVKVAAVTPGVPVSAVEADASGKGRVGK
jgi:ribonuclease P protein component